MGQVTIYLDDETEHRLKSAAAAANVPVSRWVATLVKDKTRVNWPDAVRSLRGAWSDFPQLDDLRREVATDVQREPF